MILQRKRKKEEDHNLVILYIDNRDYSLFEIYIYHLLQHLAKKPDTCKKVGKPSKTLIFKLAISFKKKN